MKLNKIDMINFPILRKFKALTIGDLKSLIEEFKLSEQKCMNSNFTEEYTLKLVNENSFENFEPITGVYEDCGVTFVSEFNRYSDCSKTVSTVLNDLINVKDHLEIDRDVDDGYVFDSYENVLITKTHLIFF